MNLVVIGLGSMGKRRIRLIREMYPEYLVYGIDAREDRCKDVSEEFSIKCFRSLDEAGKGIDAAFVCTSPLSHSSIIRQCILRKWNVFTELNLVDDGYDENIELAKENEVSLFLSSTFLYREEIRYISSKITKDVKWNYIYHIGQYLPDWHPWESYKDFFLGDKRTNGCREILAIELPWLTGAFGDVREINVVNDKMTNLDIDFNDNYIISLTHEGGNKGCLVVDVVSPVGVRKLETYSEGKYICWGGTPESLQEFDQSSNKLSHVRLNEKTEHMEGYNSFVVENAYKNEIREFFDVLTKDKKPLYGFEQDKVILAIINKIGA